MPDPAPPPPAEARFIDFQGLLPWVFRVLLLFTVVLPLALVKARGVLQVLAAVGGTTCCAGLALVWACRAHLVTVALRRLPEGGAELRVGGRRLALPDARVCRLGLYRDRPRGWMRRRAMTRDYVHLVVPCADGVVVLEALLLRPVAPPDVPWLDEPGKRRPRALRSLHPWPGPVARMARALGVWSGAEDPAVEPRSTGGGPA